MTHHPIIAPDYAIQFAYDESARYSYFAIRIQKLDTKSWSELRFPLDIGGEQLAQSVSQDILKKRGASASALTQSQLEAHGWHYQANAYYLYTLLHDPKLRDFAIRSQEWYTRHFLESIIGLMVEARPSDFSPSGVSDPLAQEVIGTAIRMARSSQVNAQ